MSTQKLVDRIVALHDHTGAPFDLFVTEALRTIGFPVREDPPEEEVRDGVAEAVRTYLELVEASEPFADVLGPVFSEVSSHGRRQNAGQFFTPWDLSVAIAELTLGDWKPRPNPDNACGLWSVLEPACGSGAMLLALYHLIQRRHGPEALRLWYAEAWDIDYTLARTCALQVLVTLARREWAVGEILVIHGDTLRMERRSIVLHAEARPRVRTSPPDHRRTTTPQQLTLFGEDAA